MHYIDGFVVPVPTDKTGVYRELAAKAWFVWPSKEIRDQGNAKMRHDPRMKMTPDMPFDGQRMIFGGFEVLLDNGKEQKAFDGR